MQHCLASTGKYKFKKVSTWNVKTALAEVGGLGKPSKMPTFSYNLPAEECNVGSKLRLVKGSVKRMSRLRARMNERIPYGPLRQILSNKEIRMEFQNMNPDAKIQMMQQVGDEEWRRMMEDLYGNNNGR